MKRAVWVLALGLGYVAAFLVSVRVRHSVIAVAYAGMLWLIHAFIVSRSLSLMTQRMESREKLVGSFFGWHMKFFKKYERLFGKDQLYRSTLRHYKLVHVWPLVLFLTVGAVAIAVNW